MNADHARALKALLKDQNLDQNQKFSKVKELLIKTSAQVSALEKQNETQRLSLSTKEKELTASTQRNEKLEALCR